MWAVITLLSVALGSHVRSTDPILSEALAEGIRDSATIRHLVDTIDASDVIVYLARGHCPSPAVACVMVTGSGRDARYLRVNFRLGEGRGKGLTWNRDELSAELAHELQHVAEIASWPDVVDGPSLQAAYRRHGLDNGGRHLDTDAAIHAGDARRAELGGRRP